MQARLRVTGGIDPDAELVSLRDWLVRDDDFRGRVDIQRQPIAPDQMGAVSEALTVALAGGGALTVLAGSVRVWLEQRRSEISVEIVDDAGNSTKIDAKGPAADTVAKNLDPDRP